MSSEPEMLSLASIRQLSGLTVAGIVEAASASLGFKIQEFRCVSAGRENKPAEDAFEAVLARKEWRWRMKFFLVWNYEGLSGIKREIKDLHMPKIVKSDMTVDCGGD